MVTPVTFPSISYMIYMEKMISDTQRTKHVYPVLKFKKKKNVLKFEKQTTKTKNPDKFENLKQNKTEIRHRWITIKTHSSRFTSSVNWKQWRSQYRGNGAECPPWQRKICQKLGKNQEKRGKVGKKSRKRGKIGKKRPTSGRFFHFAPPDK